MKKDTVMAIVLGVLLLVSVIQAVQLNTLKSNLQDGVSIKSTSTPAQSGASESGGLTVPASLDSLPTMVGGC
jgi:hypothetical protein